MKIKSAIIFGLTVMSPGYGWAAAPLLHVSKTRGEIS